MAGRRTIYNEDQRKAMFWRMNQNSGNQPPLNKPPKPPKQPKPPKVPSAPTHHGTTPHTTPTTGGGMGNYSPLGQLLGTSSVAIGISGAVGSGPLGAGAVGFGLLAGYTIPMLPGWGQPISFFSVMQPEHGGGAIGGNLLGVWQEIMSGLGSPFEGTIFDDFSLIQSEHGGSTQNTSNTSEYYRVASNAGLTEVPPPNWGGGGANIRREVWNLLHGQGFTQANTQDNAGANHGGSMFTP
jgi:hypothetical protein